jgi:hypothetical protein
LYCNETVSVVGAPWKVSVFDPRSRPENDVNVIVAVPAVPVDQTSTPVSVPAVGTAMVNERRPVEEVGLKLVPVPEVMYACPVTVTV